MDDNKNYQTSSTKNKNTGVSNLWNKLSFKDKLIVIGVGAALVFFMFFIVVLISPLMSLGIINIEGAGNVSSSSSAGGYSSVSESTKYWWPVGSIDTTTKNGIIFASGEPVSVTITSGFGDQESFRNSGHGGIDIGHGGYGTGVVPIIAVKDGEVIYPTSKDQVSKPDSSSLQGGGYGNYVKIQHDDGTITVYGHLYKDSITVLSGQKVKQGQVIGKMGASGNVTGPHLHFEVIVNGDKTYPLNYVSADNPRPKGYSGVLNHVTGSSNKQTICLTLKNSNFPNNSVAALLRNISSESAGTFDPTIKGDNGTSYGLCQWHLSRWDNLKSTFPDSYDTVQGQLEFLMYELKGYNSLNSSLVNGSKSASDLAYDFCYSFERPANKTTTCRKRANATDDFLNYVNNGCN